MFDIGGDGGSKPKCLVTNHVLSDYIDHDRPPTKKRPFTTISNQRFSHTLDLLLPEPAANSILENSKKQGSAQLMYAKVHLKLHDMLSGEFFNTYIKNPGSNVLMVSEGRPGVETYYALCNGVVRIELDKATFEKTGLEGHAISSEGRKHIKARYAIELDLRQPNMVHGKRGFERAIWASKNVLKHAVTWLFTDLGAGQSDLVSGPISQFAPTWCTPLVDVQEVRGACVPSWPATLAEEDYELGAELLEWISLAMMPSPMVKDGDNTDPYLCRYQVPTEANDARKQDLVRLRWRGLISPAFIQKMLLAGLEASGSQWLALGATAFNAEAYAILVHEKRCITWQYQD